MSGSGTRTVRRVLGTAPAHAPRSARAETAAKSHAHLSRSWDAARRRLFMRTGILIAGLGAPAAPRTNCYHERDEDPLLRGDPRAVSDAVERAGAAISLRDGGIRLCRSRVSREADHSSGRNRQSLAEDHDAVPRRS